MAPMLADPRCAVNSIDLDCEIVKVTVGEGETERSFLVHEKLVRASSPFFEAALSKEWKEGHERIVKLPEDGADVFQVYLKWLYTGKLHSMASETDNGYVLLAKAYSLGEKLMDKAFQDQIINGIVAATKIPVDGGLHYPGSSTFNEIYENTPQDSPARRLMVDLYVFHGGAQWIKTDKPGLLNHEFTVDLCAALLGNRDLTGYAKQKLHSLHANVSVVPCSYHQHGKDEPCGGY